MKWRIGTAEGSLHRDPGLVQEEGRTLPSALYLMFGQHLGERLCF